MCLLLIAYDTHPRYRLVVAANRDEFYARPTAPAAWWDDEPNLLAGRDLEQSGTWLGVTRAGRWAGLTNFRDPAARKPAARSRGLLVSEFLRSAQSVPAYLAQLSAERTQYNDFNLLAWDGVQLGYFGSRAGGRILPSGVYALSNHLLDTPWPKVERGKSALTRAIEQEPRDDELFGLLTDTSHPDGARLPDTGVGPALERALAPIFVRTDNYGTRCSTLLRIDHTGQVVFQERSYNHLGSAGDTLRFEFLVQRAVSAAHG